MVSPASPLAAAARPALVALVAAALLAAIAGGLARAGVALPDGALSAHSAGSHAALMLSVFFGAVIAVERAVALGRPWAFAAPFAAGAAGVLMLVGEPTAASALGVVAASTFVAVNVALMRRQMSATAAILLLGALAWLAGNATGLAWPGDPAAIVCWFAFPVLTVTAERLELTQFMPRRPAARLLLALVVLTVVAGAASSPFDAVAGALAFGAGLLGLSAWLFAYDVVRRTISMPGLARYMAVSLLAGYAWLGVAGLAWIGTAVGCPGRDMALHALGIGFVFSMVMGHAPVIVPAVTGVKLRFGAAFYAPLVLLHGSLALRLFAGIGEPGWRALGARLNAAAIGLFLLTVAGAALLARFDATRTRTTRRRIASEGTRT